MDVNFDNKTPIYIQIMYIIKRDMAKGKLKGGDKLPSVRELSSKLKVNPNTVQRTYQELERSGFTFTERGKGTFVTEDEDIVSDLKKDLANKVLEDFIKGMKNLGFDADDIIDIVSERIKKEGK